ncbi:family 16 glycoside hydrolase [Tenacibaculum agarivorans]|uniref:family 16 glycoside hydrolase n=1 Tax=Tenacibaculum agarivorans TaxID=1908389 RepID=UPI00094BBAFF|nr:family 16 glycoside hydrolase [Tenacibaculum agarivorans]
MTKILFTIISFLGLQLAFGQNELQNIDLIPSKWNVPNDAIFEEFDNRKTLVLKRGRAKAKNLNFSNGTIEVDIYANVNRSFAGINFRDQNNHSEEVYVRMHKSNQVDAVQYTPIFNNESNWQLYREHQAKVTLKQTGWNTLRIEVHHQSAEIFVNKIKVMTVSQLKTDQFQGGVGLWALFGNRFSNFKISHGDSNKTPNSIKVAKEDPNIITNWNISKAFPYIKGKLNFEAFSKEKYTTVSTEKSGLVPISKYVKKSSAGRFEQNKEDYVVATKIIHSKRKKTLLFSFDYSDKIIVYLNGKVIFKGNNAFRSKGIQYTGHIDINTNKLYLELEKGDNKIHCVVIDKANGWGLIGKLE